MLHDGPNKRALWPWREFSLSGEAIRFDLSERLAPLAPDLAALIRETSTEISLIDTPYLPSAKVYKVLRHDPLGARLEYLGIGADGGLALLTENRSAFVAMAQADGLEVGDEETAIAYALAALEIGRDLSVLTYALASAADLWFRSDGAEKDAVLAKYRSRIQPPSAQRLEFGYMVEAFFANQTNLELHHVFVTPTGSLDDQVSLLDAGLPLVVGVTPSSPMESDWAAIEQGGRDVP
jgi:hypothetical protein